MSAGEAPPAHQDKWLESSNLQGVMQMGIQLPSVEIERGLPVFVERK
jgi:hypothetical protein